MKARIALLALLLLGSSIGAIACEIVCLPHVVHCHKVLIQTDEASPQLSQDSIDSEQLIILTSLIVQLPSPQPVSVPVAMAVSISSTPSLQSPILRI